MTPEQRRLLDAAHTISVFVLSSAHLRQETCDALCTGKLDIFTVPWREYGVLCWIPEDAHELQVPGVLPDDLQLVLRYASERDFQYVRFDRDTPQHLALPVYASNLAEPEPDAARAATH